MIKRMIKPWDAAPSATPCHNDYCGAGTRYSIWRCATKGHADYHQHEPASLGSRDGVQDELARGGLEDRW
jgi:hypothetical protein